MKKVIPIILAGLILFGCSADTTQNKAIQTANPAIEEKQTASEEAKDITSSAGNAGATKTANKVKPEYQKYADFLGVDDEEASFIREDIDLDGKQEIVISFGIDFVDAFVLREDDAKLTLIGKIGGDGYNTYEVELVRLQGLKQKYIMTKLTNGANLYGFALYKIFNNGLEQIAYSASATGSGDDYLVDAEKDGKFDGYVQERRSYDVMHFPTTRIYKLEGEKFVLESSHMELGDYPETSEKVVEQYLELSIVHEEKSQEYDSRFKELSVSDKDLAIDGDESWYLAITTKTVDLTSAGSETNVKVTAANEEDNIVFSLVLKNNKWQIADILQPQKQQTTAAEQPPAGKEWFAGVIGNAKVHAKIDVCGDEVSGVYYYDQYKSNINLTGYIEDSMKGMQTIRLTENTDKKGEIHALFRSRDYIQGFWSNGKDIFPMYLIRENSKVTPPKQPGKAAMKFDGHWTGKTSGYFNSSEADISALFDDLIYYGLSAYNGTHLGAMDGFGIVKNGIAETIFEDKTYDEKENIVFEFSVDNDTLNLDSNRYDYMCGMGVAFDSNYTKGNVDIPVPTAQQVGIVDTKEKDELFKKLVGSEYGEFIQCTQWVDYSEVLLDGKQVNAGPSILTGFIGYCYYVVSDEHIYAAKVSAGGGITYYTNDKNYAKKLPWPMTDWVEDKKDLKVEYNYKE